MIHFRLPLIFLFFLLFQTTASADQSIPTGPLPRDVRPLSYELALTILPDREAFSGATRITVEFFQETSTVWLHGKDLRVKEAGIVLANGKKESANYSQVDEGGIARLDLQEKVVPQKAVLWFSYEATFDRKLEGLYRIQEDGSWYAFSQFEAISARRCFPGFDEPVFKTPFDISLTVRKEHVAVSNTFPSEETPLSGELKRIRFARTEKLPTYLLAFAVGTFDVVKGPDVPPNQYRNEPVPLRGIAVKGKGKDFSYALTNAGAILTLLENYFGIGYPFHKLDLIAIPDFEWGAMENAGAITFREVLVLFQEESASSIQKKSYAGAMAHELGHQWFGNLVTMAWWDDIWLNEGLTSWVDNRIVHAWKPEYKSDVAAVESALRIMEFDSTDSTHPVHRPVKDSNEIAAIADGLIFAKGAALPRMFESYLGEETFQKVIRHYLKKHEFSAVTSEDFLKAIEEVAGSQAAASFRSFLFQPGVPFVEVQNKCNGHQAVVTARQSRYVPLGGKTRGKEVWQIPICFRWEESGLLSKKCVLFSQPEASFPLTESFCPDWIMPNASGTGYYRWSLSPDGFIQLREKGQSKLTIGEKLSTVNSVRSAFATGRLSAAEAMQGLAPFAQQDIRELAMAPARLLEFFRNYLVEPTFIPVLEKYASQLYRPAYQRLGFEVKESDSDETKQFRAEVLEFLAMVARDPEIRKAAAERGRAYVGFGTDGKIHPDAVGPDLVLLVLRVAVQESNAAYYDALLGVLKTSNDSLLRSRILEALGSAILPELVQRARELSKDPMLRTNEVTHPLATLMEMKENWDDTWKWFTINYDSVMARVSQAEAGSIPLIAASFCDEGKAEEVRAFFTERVKGLPGGPSRLARTIDYITLCSAKVKAHRIGANAFFKQDKPGSDSQQP